jgi:hypothetical protein
MLGCESRGEDRQLAIAESPCILRLPKEASESFETSNFEIERAACLCQSDKTTFASADKTTYDNPTYAFLCVRNACSEGIDKGGTF